MANTVKCTQHPKKPCAICNGLKETMKSLVLLGAKEGYRIVVNGWIWWPGLGNPSGLHDFGSALTQEKWEKSGARLEKKLTKLIEDQEKAVIEIQQFKNKTRDSGAWGIKKSWEIDDGGRIFITAN